MAARLAFKDWFKIATLCLLTFGALLPTLAWHDFREVMEGFLVDTSVETVRDGHWLVPTLDGVPRLKKPPLPHWVGSAGMIAGAKVGMGDELAARWTTLLMGVATIPAVYAIASLLISSRAGIVSATAFASSYFFLKYTHRASYDVQLTCWTAWTLAALVWGVARARMLAGFSAGGILLGLALATKGPPALLSTVAPFAVWLWVSRKDYPLRGVWVAAAIGAAAAAAVGLSWYALVFATVPNALATWWASVTLGKERVEDGLTRLNSIGNLLPMVAMMGAWTLWFIVGFLIAARERMRMPTGLLLGALVVLLPAVISVIVAPLRERYLLPALVGGSLVVGSAVERVRRERARDSELLALLQWVALAGLCAAVIALSFSIAGKPDLPPGHPRIAAALAGAGLIVTAAGLAWGRKNLAGLVLATPIVMMLAGAGYFWCDSFTPGAISAAKPASRELARRFPDARFIYCGSGVSLPREFPYYLGRTVHLDDKYDALSSPVPGTLLVMARTRSMPVPDVYVPAGSYTFRKDSWDFYYFPPSR